MKSHSPDPARGVFSHPWWWTASLCVLAAAIGLYLFAPTEADPDLWGHLRFGLDLLDTGLIVRPDTYAYTSGGVPWINHEWLSEAIMAIAFRAAGPAGLIAVKVAIGLSVGALLVWHLRRVGFSLLAALLIAAYAIAVMLPGFRSLRPQAFTYLAFLGVLLLIQHVEGEHARTSGRAQASRLAPWGPLSLVATVFALWANLHGGFVAGLGVLLVWAVMRPRWSSSLLVAMAAAATLVNPYGVGLWTFLARTLGPRPDIAEWQAISLTTIEGVAYLAVLAFGAIGAVGLWRRRDWLALTLFAGGALLPFVARRHLPLFVLITVVFCARARARQPQAQASPSSERFRPIVAATMLLQAIVLLAIAVPQLGRIRVNPADYPIAATARLVASGVAANVAVDFDWGEYVIWHAGPHAKVSVDGRRETVYSDAAYEDNRRLTAGADGWDRLLTQQPTDLALVSVRTGAYARLVHGADWDLLMKDETSALFGRHDAPATRAIRATPVPAIDPRRATIFP